MIDKFKPGESKADKQTIRDEAEASDRERARKADERSDRSAAARDSYPYAEQSPQRLSWWQRVKRYWTW